MMNVRRSKGLRQLERGHWAQSTTCGDVFRSDRRLSHSIAPAVNDGHFASIGHVRCEVRARYCNGQILHQTHYAQRHSTYDHIGMCVCSMYLFLIRK